MYIIFIHTYASSVRAIVQIVIQSDLVYAPKRFFLAGKAREIIKTTLHEKLCGVVYDGEVASGWVREIVDTIRNRLKGNHTSMSKKCLVYIKFLHIYVFQNQLCY